MKRKTKNIIMLLLLVIMICATVFTMYYAKNHLNNMDNDFRNMKGEMPSIGKDNNDFGNRPNGNDMQGEKPPEKPDKKEDSNTKDDSNSSVEEDTEKSDDTTSEDTTTDTEREDKTLDGNMPNINRNRAQLTILYYIIFGIESLIISVIIIYLIMSGFNKKKLKEVFSSSDKVLITILSIVIVTIGLTFLDKIVTEKVFLENPNKKFDLNKIENKTDDNQTEEDQTDDNQSTSSASA